MHSSRLERLWRELDKKGKIVAEQEQGERSYVPDSGRGQASRRGIRAEEDTKNMSDASQQESGTPIAVMANLEARIRRQEDFLFGVSLYFDGLTLLHAGQTDSVRAQGKVLRSILRTRQAQIDDATSLLRRARDDAGTAEQLALVKLDEISPEIADIAARATALLTAYAELYPDRDRTEPLDDEEMFSLIESATEGFTDSPPG